MKIIACDICDRQIGTNAQEQEAIADLDTVGPVILTVDQGGEPADICPPCHSTIGGVIRLLVRERRDGAA